MSRPDRPERPERADRPDRPPRDTREDDVAQGGKYIYYCLHKCRMVINQSIEWRRAGGPSGKPLGRPQRSEESSKGMRV